MRYPEREWVLAAFPDVEGDFNNPSFAAVCSAVGSRGANRAIEKWIESMLHCRRLELTLKETRVEAVRGCPQGGTLSPFCDLSSWTLLIELNRNGYSCTLMQMTCALLLK